MNDLIKAKEELKSNGYTCVLCNGEKLQCLTERGVRPILSCLDSGYDYSGYSAADRVVGKATAFLYVLLGVKAVYAQVISQSALQVMKEHNVAIESDVVAEYIINRRGDGICPFEAAVLDVSEPSKAYEIIKSKLNSAFG